MISEESNIFSESWEILGNPAYSLRGHLIAPCLSRCQSLRRALVKEADPCAAEAFARYVAQLEAEAAAAEALEGGIVRRQNEVPPCFSSRYLSTSLTVCLFFFCGWWGGQNEAFS